MTHTNQTHIKGALEAMLFVSTDPLRVNELAEILETDQDTINALLHDLQESYEERAAGIRLREIAGGWRLFSAPDYHEEVEALVLSWDKSKLSQAALETLAVVAYHQPVTREGIRAIRGVNSDGVLSSIIEKGYVREAGRSKEKDGGLGAKTYRTTDQFLEHFGLGSIKDLPNLEDFAPSEEAKEFIRERLSSPQTSFVFSSDEEELPNDEQSSSKDALDLELNEVTEEEIEILEEEFDA